LNESAVVEPDVDGDAFGDETQDACPGVFGSVTGCPKADLAITKTASQGAESDLVTYTLTVKNNGPDPVSDAKTSDTLPTGATFVSSTGPGGAGGRCSASGRSASCGIGPLAGGASATFNITARLKAGSGQTNTATISSALLALASTRANGAGDPKPANNTATATIVVFPPRVSSAKASPSTFRLGNALPKFSRRTPAGTTISFKLSERVKATLAFSRPKPGRRVKRRCVPASRKNRLKPRCTRRVGVGSRIFNAHKGLNKVRFQGRISKTKRLKPGRYTLTITAADSAGNRSKPKTLSLTVLSKR
jgi:uncharacterized repeat protein (TIGR01451 family)